ncbi:MAG: hypothetical protein CME70_22510 [Halobacteriovorax sp.]|nr:hypothetical protein [Halobacteriovorax sp.]|tara:strand:- start:66792 stop:69692 length:2901 start_codon:yes stop_codon:yes gene_type:complete
MPASVISCHDLALNLLENPRAAGDLDELTDAVFRLKIDAPELEGLEELLRGSPLFNKLSLGDQAFNKAIRLLKSEAPEASVNKDLKKLIANEAKSYLSKENSSFKELRLVLTILPSLKLESSAYKRLLKNSNELKILGLTDDESIKGLVDLISSNNTRDEIYKRFLFSRISNMGSSADDDFYTFPVLVQNIKRVTMTAEEMDFYFKDADLGRVLGIRKSALKRVVKDFREGTDLDALIKKHVPDHSTIGIEFEGSIPDDVSYFEVAKSMRGIISELYPGKEISITGKSGSSKISFEKDGLEYIYVVKSDASLKFEAGKNGVEIVSPIIRDGKDLANHIELLSRLKKLGVDQRPDQAGIHIHYGIDTRSVTHEQLLELFQAFHKMEANLRKVFHVNEGRGYLGRQNLERAMTSLSTIALSNPNRPLSSRTGRNAFSSSRAIIRFINSYGTLESRYFNSTLEPEILELYTDFTIRFLEAWKRGDANVLGYIKNTSEDEISILKIAELLDARLAKESDKFDSLLNDNMTFDELKLALEAPRERQVLELSELDQVKNSYELSDLAYQLENISEAEFKESFKKIIDHKLSSEFSLTALGRSLSNPNLDEELVTFYSRELLKKSRGDALETLIPSLYKKLGGEKTHKLLEAEILPEATDYQIRSLLLGISKREEDIPELTEFITKHFIDKEIPDVAMEIIPNILWSQKDISSGMDLFKKIIARDFDFTLKKKKLLMNFLFERGEDELIETTLKNSAYKEVYGKFLMEKLSESTLPYDPKYFKWITISQSVVKKEEQMLAVMKAMRRFDEDLPKVEASKLLGKMLATYKSYNIANKKYVLDFATYLRDTSLSPSNIDEIFDYFIFVSRKSFEAEYIVTLIDLMGRNGGSVLDDKAFELLSSFDDVSVSILGKNENFLMLSNGLETLKSRYSDALDPSVKQKLDEVIQRVEDAAEQVRLNPERFRQSDNSGEAS